MEKHVHACSVTSNSFNSMDPGIEPASPVLQADYLSQSQQGLRGGSVVKNLPVNSGEVGLIPGWEISPGGGNGNPLQYSCQKNSMNRGAWQGYSPKGCKESDVIEVLSMHKHKPI